MAISTVPTPLYVLYQQRDGFSTLTVTIVFAVYGVGVVTSLLLLGHVSDWVGRKRILVSALVLEITSTTVFLVWPALPGLIVGRLICGVAVGMITATATAHLNELDSAGRPGTGKGRFEIVSTMANVGGLGIGALISGVFAQYVPSPLRTPYLVFGVLLVAAVVAVVATPETVQKRTERQAWYPQRIQFGRGGRLTYFVGLGCILSAFAMFGLFTSVALGFVAGSLHHPSRALAGLIVFLVFGAAALTQLASSSLRQATRLAMGIAAEASGVVLVGTGIHSQSLTVFLIGGALAGAGAGILFKSAVSAVASSAEPSARGEALAGLFLFGYFGLIGPAVAVGIAIQHASVSTVVYWFCGTLLVVLAVTAALFIAERH
jgi:MFS family permease